MAKVKICGLTNLEDANKAEELGADFLGFIFFKESRRSLPAEKISQITENLSGRAKKVGLFLNQDLEYVISRAKECGFVSRSAILGRVIGTGREW